MKWANIFAEKIPLAIIWLEKLILCSLQILMFYDFLLNK